MLTNTASTAAASLIAKLSAELTQSTAFYYPRESMTDAGKDFDGRKYAQVVPSCDTAQRATRDMNRPGTRFYVVRLDMETRTYRVRTFAASASYAVPVTPAWKPEPDANPYPGRLDVRTVARIALAFSRFLNRHGFTLRVSGNSAATSFHVTACAMFATEDDARAFAVANRIGYYYAPDGTTRGTVPDDGDDATE